MSIQKTEFSTTQSAEFPNKENNTPEVFCLTLFVFVLVVFVVYSIHATIKNTETVYQSYKKVDEFTNRFKK